MSEHYDTANFDPPAPVAFVTLQHPSSGVSLSGVPMLIDTGADITFLPRAAVDELKIVPLPESRYEVESFDGSLSLAEVVRADLSFLGKNFKGQFLLTDQEMGIIGRNILNAIHLEFDGPNLVWGQQT